MSIKDAESLVAAAEIKKEHEPIGNDSEMSTQPLNALVETTLESTNSEWLLLCQYGAYFYISQDRKYL